MTPRSLARPIDRRELGVQFLRLAAALAVPAPAMAFPADGPHRVAVQRDVMIAMRDGVKLATDIYRPVDGDTPLPGPFPVILERTPYGKSQDSTRHASAAIARMLASHGYVVVFQDCRGRGGSQGDYVKYLSDGQDGSDCCAWILAQSWCNGRIGAQGLSYGAHTVGAMAGAALPEVDLGDQQHPRAGVVLPMGSGARLRRHARRRAARWRCTRSAQSASPLATASAGRRGASGGPPACSSQRTKRASQASG